MIKVNIFYNGRKNPMLESKIQALAESCGGSKGGDWSFEGSGMQSLFLFKKDSYAEDFSTKARLKIDSRLTITLESPKKRGMY